MCRVHIFAPEHRGLASLGCQPHIKGRRGQLAELPVGAVRVVHADPGAAASLRMHICMHGSMVAGNMSDCALLLAASLYTAKHYMLLVPIALHMRRQHAP